MIRVEQRCRRAAGFVLLAMAIGVPAAAQAQVQAQSPSGADPSPAGDGNLRISVGATYSEGRYGQAAKTEIATVPVSAKYTRGRFSVRVTGSYVHIRGPGTLLDGTGSGASGSGNSGSGSGGSEVSDDENENENEGGSGSGSGSDDAGETITPTVVGAALLTPARTRTRGGLGDTTVTLAYALPLGDMFALEPRARVKLPTASSRKGIGTGKVDVTLAADLVGMFGSATVYAGARRRFLGRTALFPVRDGWGFGGGASYQLPGGLTIGADYDWLQSAVPRRGPISEASLWVSAKLTRTLRLQAYGGTGFTARSADALGGLTLVWRP